MSRPDQRAVQKEARPIGDLPTGFAVTLPEDRRASYYRARYYDPSTGRFIGEDPIRFKGGVNFYAYTLNNPANHSDPDGLRTRVCCRYLRGLGHLTFFRHCYIQIANEGGSHTYGLHREDANNILYPGGARPVRDDPTDSGGTCADVPDATPCKEHRLEQGFANPNCPSCGQNYNVFATNSNFWAAWTLTQFGMSPPTFSGGDDAPGYFPQTPNFGGK